MTIPRGRFGLAALAVALAAVAAWPAAPPAGASDTGDVRLRAVDLYDRGSYAEALPVLTQLDAEGKATGPLLYRLAFSQRSAGKPEWNQTLERARATLEQELPAAAGLEVPFYLINTYQILGRASDMTRLAGETTRRVEAGELSEPTSAIEMFRLGKLYGDLGLAPKASVWYAKALDVFGSAGDGSRIYRQWAARYLGEQAMQQRDFATAAKRLGELAAIGAVSPNDLDQLAVARARLGRYAEAKEAWRKAEDLDPAESDRARYCGRLMDLAAQAGELPASAPSGQLWGQLSKEELEKLMKEQTDIVRRARSEAEQATELTEEKHSALAAQMIGARTLFVPAALEYALNGHPIRETAFLGGYAPLIFHPDEWILLPRE